MNTKALILTAALGLTSALALGQTTFNVDFDTADNWTAGSGTIGSYQSDHTYAESGWSFTSADSLRNSNADQGDVPGAFGTYSWRVRGQTDDVFSATYNSSLAVDEYFDSFSFQARRWSGDDPTFSVEYSVNGGTDFTQAANIGAVTFSDNNWGTFSQSFSSPTNLSAGDFIVQIRSTNSSERFMVDNFGATTAIPEPGTLALIGVSALLLYFRRRMKA